MYPSESQEFSQFTMLMRQLELFLRFVGCFTKRLKHIIQPPTHANDFSFFLKRKTKSDKHFIDSKENQFLHSFGKYSKVHRDINWSNRNFSKVKISFTVEKVILTLHFQGIFFFILWTKTPLFYIITTRKQKQKIDIKNVIQFTTTRIHFYLTKKKQNKNISANEGLSIKVNRRQSFPRFASDY